MKGWALISIGFNESVQKYQQTQGERKQSIARFTIV